MTALLAIWAATTNVAWAQIATWDGGDGSWTDSKWNSGFDALSTFGTEKGVEYAAVGPNDFVIGGGSHVLYLAGPGGVDGDFRLDSSKNGGGPTSGTIRDGATLELRTEEAQDGLWTEWDGNLTLDNGVLKRTFQSGGTAESSGAHMFGSWNTAELTNHQINVALTNGGRLENHGMLMFGAWNESGAGLKVTVTINNGSLDLTGGDGFTLNDAASQNADLHFYYGTVNDTGSPKAESYVINFTGPGSIKVDRAGIRVHNIGAEYATWVDEAKTFQQLWDLGILRANGQSGLNGAAFGDHFSVTGSAGQDDYTLTALAGNVAGDFDGNRIVNGEDFLVWQRGGSPNPLSAGDLAAWEANFGAGLAAASVAAVPEPASLAVALAGLGGLALARRRRV